MMELETCLGLMGKKKMYVRGKNLKKEYISGCQHYVLLSFHIVLYSC